MCFKESTQKKTNIIERLQSSRKERYATASWKFTLTLTVCVYTMPNTLCSEFVSLLVLSSLLFFSVSFVCVCVFFLLTWDCLNTNALFFLKAWVLFGGYVSGIWSHQCCKLLRYNVRFLKQAELNTRRDTRNKDPASLLISFFNIAYFTILPGTGAPHSWIMWKFKRASTWKW